MPGNGAAKRGNAAGGAARRRLAERRKALGLTQEALADLMGVERTTVVRWERGDTDPQAFTQLQRGRYLTVLSDCASCHTVPGSNKPFAGGRSIETPFGNIVTPNITPDAETGIGSWSDEQFDAAVRKGIARNGSRLYPAMPEVRVVLACRASFRRRWRSSLAASPSSRR